MRRAYRHSKCCWPKKKSGLRVVGLILIENRKKHSQMSDSQYSIINSAEGPQASVNLIRQIHTGPVLPYPRDISPSKTSPSKWGSISPSSSSSALPPCWPTGAAADSVNGATGQIGAVAGNAIRAINRSLTRNAYAVILTMALTRDNPWRTSSIRGGLLKGRPEEGIADQSQMQTRGWQKIWCPSYMVP